MALGQPESAAFEPPGSLSDNRIRAALRKAQDQIETQPSVSGGITDRFSLTREAHCQSTPVGGGIITEAGISRREPSLFQHAGQVMLGTGAKALRRSWSFPIPFVRCPYWFRRRAIARNPDTLTIRARSCSARERPSPPTWRSQRAGKNIFRPRKH